jgi:hypothetical protein
VRRAALLSSTLELHSPSNASRYICCFPHSILIGGSHSSQVARRRVSLQDLRHEDHDLSEVFKQEIAKAQHRAAAMRRRAQHSSYEQHAINPSMEDEEELEEDADADETWDAPLQRLQVYRVANAEALLWVRHLTNPSLRLGSTRSRRDILLQFPSCVTRASDP